MGLLLQSKDRPRETFLQKFYKVRRIKLSACGAAEGQTGTSAGERR